MNQPPDIALGEYALPLSFELAKKLRKPPRKIAEEIVASLGTVDGFAKIEVAGAGYINARLDRQAAATYLLKETRQEPLVHYQPSWILVEHTSINPNKAAHIGHLRNAILGDTFVRLKTFFNAYVYVQNYIDNTGVQVADVVVGLLYLEKKGKAEIEKLIASTNPPFDYYCWDLYAQVSQWYEQDKDRLKLRLQTLHDLEQGGNEAAEIGRLISNAIVRRHLQTMERLNIHYDFLPQESEILHLHFWDLAFEQLKQKGVVYLETEGKNKGCWVMRRPGSKPVEKEGPDEDAKVLVRSNGTVTYVGKDIAYHLWKFNLLGRDFGYKRFYRYPDGEDVWISAESGEPNPFFAGTQYVYNVIDARQSDAQNNVVEALRALGYSQEADRCIHFSYGMVVLTPDSAVELGFEVSEEDRKRSHIELSGRKGFGVKADDLLDALIAAARKEVDARHQELNESERRDIATQIAVSALRYFMLKFTRNSLIAFDLKEALSFEGETGPYIQYAVVRATNIFRKAGIAPIDVLTQPDLRFLNEAEENGNEIWQLWLIAGQLSSVVAQCNNTKEPAYIAKYAFQLAQQFNNFYHRHHILTEPDPERKKFLLATVAVVHWSLTDSLWLMRITVPKVM